MIANISLTVLNRAILKICQVNVQWNKKIKCTLMKCHTNVNYTPPTQLPHTFSYIVAILTHNHFESPNISIKKKTMKIIFPVVSVYTDCVDTVTSDDDE
jgi:hypothetical protein